MAVKVFKHLYYLIKKPSFRTTGAFTDLYAIISKLIPEVSLNALFRTTGKTAFNKEMLKTIVIAMVYDKRDINIIAVVPFYLLKI